MRDESLNGERPAPDLEPADLWLRESLDPSREQVERVVRHALREGEARAASPHRTTWALAAAAGILTLLAGGAAALYFRGRTTEPAGGRVILSENLTTPTITNASGKVDLFLPKGWEAGRRPGRPAGQAPEPVRIFNSDGCVAMVLPEGPIRYRIIGGAR